MNVFKMTLAMNNVAPWDDLRLETCRSDFKCFNVNILCKCICWLIIKVVKLLFLNLVVVESILQSHIA